MSGLKLFSARNIPLLSQGNTMALVARAPGLWAHIKVYADGGENGLHCHPSEDHLFFVLQGEATFLDGDGTESKVVRYEGVTVPRGSAYAFHNSGDNNLIMLRIGSPIRPELAADSPDFPGVPLAAADRRHLNGRDFRGDDAANKTGAQSPVFSGTTFAG